MNNLWEILYDSLWTVQNGLNKPSWESIHSNDVTTINTLDLVYRGIMEVTDTTMEGILNNMIRE